jgi:hypothetical protein
LDASQLAELVAKALEQYQAQMVAKCEETIKRAVKEAMQSFTADSRAEKSVERQPSYMSMPILAQHTQADSVSVDLEWQTSGERVQDSFSAISWLIDKEMGEPASKMHSKKEKESEEESSPPAMQSHGKMRQHIISSNEEIMPHL